MNEPTAIKTISAEQATERLRRLGMKITPTQMREYIYQKVWTFGDCIRNSETGSMRCIIYEKLFDQWIAERAS